MIPKPMLFTATAVASFCHARARQHFISHSLTSLPQLAPNSPPHHEHSGGASGRDNHSRMEGGAPKREGGVRHRYCSPKQLSTITKRERERRKMELALQPSLLASLCWWQKDGGSAMMAERVGGRGSSKSSLLLQKPQLSLKAPSCVLGAHLWPTCSHCLSKGG